MSRNTKIARWTARLITGLVLLFWGFMMVGHLIGNANHDSRPLTSFDYTILVSLSVSLLGLGIACRHELVGAVIALLGISVCAWMNWRVLIFPGALIPLAAVLFLVAALSVRSNDNSGTLVRN